MPNGKNPSRYQQGAIKRYYENRDTAALQNLGDIVSDLYLCQDSTRAARLWDRAAKALAHTDAEAATAQKIVAERDVAGLSRLVNHLAAPGGQHPGQPMPTIAPAAPGAPTAGPGTQTPPPKPPVDPLDKVVLKTALKAFRKRLKLTRLDEESKLGVGPLTGGRRSGVVAITPPSQYPTAVWEQLVEQGSLKRAGTGFYALAGE